MKTALVTGGSRGIGSAIALTLGKTFHVVVGFVNSEDKANDIVKQIVATGGSASTVQIDISDAESVDNAFAAIEKEYNSVDVLINNAGVTKDNILPRMKEDEWLEVIQTNLTGSFYTSQRAIKLMMKNKWGRIINISSAAAALGNKGQSNYVAAKAGIEAMSKTLAREVGSKNITVNCVAPGFIETDMLKDLDEAYLSAIASEIPLQRLGKTEEIASLVKFLASDEANYITGQTVHINGGLFM